MRERERTNKKDEGRWEIREKRRDKEDVEESRSEEGKQGEKVRESYEGKIKRKNGGRWGNKGKIVMRRKR